ncbi:hypothetical protein QOT17_014715 [Balamuthia mandrillaris]
MGQSWTRFQEKREIKRWKRRYEKQKRNDMKEKQKKKQKRRKQELMMEEDLLSSPRPELDTNEIPVVASSSSAAASAGSIRSLENTRQHRRLKAGLDRALQSIPKPEGHDDDVLDLRRFTQAMLSLQQAGLIYLPTSKSPQLLFELLLEDNYEQPLLLFQQQQQSLQQLSQQQLQQLQRQNMANVENLTLRKDQVTLGLILLNRPNAKRVIDWTYQRIQKAKNKNRHHRWKQRIRPNPKIRRNNAYDLMERAYHRCLKMKEALVQSDERTMQRLHATARNSVRQMVDEYFITKSLDMKHSTMYEPLRDWAAEHPLMVSALPDLTKARAVVEEAQQQQQQSVTEEEEAFFRPFKMEFDDGISILDPVTSSI